MAWSPDQDRSLKSVADWLQNSDQQVFRLFGYAGTGKTTLAQHFAQGVGGGVLFGAYTGKAAHVLRSKGCSGAQTIHSMIYHTKEKGRARLKDLEQSLMELMTELREAYKLTPEQIDEHRRVKDIRELIRSERKSLSQPTFSLNEESEVRQAKLVIIDECSMVDSRMGEDLLSFGTKVLVLGDPAQLPPVMGGGFFTEGTDPDVMLTEIHRQARDNPIIDMATRVRNREVLPLGNYGLSMVVEGSGIGPEDALSADQILVGRNKTRTASNARVRALKGIPEAFPVDGDKLVCLRNNHEKSLLNGAIWYVEDVGQRDEERIYMTVRPEASDTSESIEVEAHLCHFLGRGDQLAWWERKEAEEFDYGYALTVHKSQGSQWNNVMLFDESSVFREDRWKWLYTGITRAAERLQIVRL